MEKFDNISDRVMQIAANSKDRQAKAHHFDIFKGVADSTGRIQKIRSVGTALLREGSHTAFVFLYSLIGQQLYLLPERKRTTDADYILLTRELSHQPGKKYFWRVVGEAHALTEQNSDLIRVSLDLFGADDLFLRLGSLEGKRLSQLVAESAMGAPAGSVS